MNKRNYRRSVVAGFIYGESYGLFANQIGEYIRAELIGVLPIEAAKTYTEAFVRLPF